MIGDGRLGEFLLTPHGGHLLAVRNALFVLHHALFGRRPLRVPRGSAEQLSPSSLAIERSPTPGRAPSQGPARPPVQGSAAARRTRASSSTTLSSRTESGSLVNCRHRAAAARVTALSTPPARPSAVRPAQYGGQGHAVTIRMIRAKAFLASSFSAVFTRAPSCIRPARGPALCPGDLSAPPAGGLCS